MHITFACYLASSQAMSAPTPREAPVKITVLPLILVIGRYWVLDMSNKTLKMKFAVINIAINYYFLRF